MSTTPLGPTGATDPTRARSKVDLLTQLRDRRISDPDDRLRAATQLLEGTFYQEMFKVMRDTVPEDGAIPAGSGQDMFAGMLDQHVADAAAGQSDRGLGSALYRYFTQAAGE